MKILEALTIIGAFVLFFFLLYGITADADNQTFPRPSNPEAHPLGEGHDNNNSSGAAAKQKGTTYYSYGNTTTDDAGNSWSTFDNTTYGSDGSTCSTYGSYTECY